MAYTAYIKQISWYISWKSHKMSSGWSGVWLYSSI